MKYLLFAILMGICLSSFAQNSIAVKEFAVENRAAFNTYAGSDIISDIKNNSPQGEYARSKGLNSALITNNGISEILLTEKQQVITALLIMLLFLFATFVFAMSQAKPV